MPAPVKAETLQYYIADIALPEDADEGEYDYCFQIGGVPLESGLLQIGTYKKKKEEYEGDVEYIEYRG